MLEYIKTHFFQNITPKQTIIKNGFRLTMSEFISRLFTFVISLRVARSLGVVEFGVYNYVMTYVVFFVLVVDFWLSNLTFRELSKNTQDLEKYFPHTLLLKWILSVLMLWVVFFITKASPESSSYLNLVIIFFIHATITNISEFIRVYFRPVERMQNEAGLKILWWAVLLVATVVSVYIKADLLHVFYWFLTASIVNLGISLYFVIRHFKIKTYHIDRRFLGRIAKMSIPFFLWGIFVYFYSDVNVVLLKYFRGTQDVWFFSAPYRLLSYIYLLFNIVSLATFKNLVDARKQSDRFKHILKKFFTYNVWIAVLAFLILFFLSKYIILLLYGADYLSTDMLLKILSVVVIVKSCSYVYGAWLTALSKEYTRLWIQIGIAIINVGANILLIPRFWPMWAAYSLVIAEVCLFIVYRIFLYKYIRNIEK